MLSERLIAFALSCVLALCATSARAEDTESLKKQASARFATGVELVSEGNYDAALVEFRRAYELVPDWRLLYNMGQVLQMMQDYPAAVEHFERYLKEGGERVAEARRESVNAEIQKLRARVAYLEITVDQAGAEVLVDDRSRGTTPLAGRIAVSVGRRKVTVRKAGFQAVERYAEVGGGEQTALDVKLEPTYAGGGDDPDTLDMPVAQRTMEPQRKVPWALWGVTAGLAVGAGVTGGLALKEKGDTEDLKDGPTTKKKLDAGKDRAFLYGVTSDVLTVAAVGVGVFALYKTFWAKPKTDERVSVDVGVARASVRVRF